MNEMSKYVSLELDEYKDLIIRADRLRGLLEIIYKSTRYSPSKEDLWITDGDNILKYLDLIDRYYGQELRKKEEEYRKKSKRREGQKRMSLNLYDQSQFLKEGGRTQEIVWIEELGELQHEITKSLRGMRNITHLIEEFADVLICLEQLKIKYNISDDELQEWIDYKYKRNLKRLEQEKEVAKKPTYDELKELFK